MPDNQHPAPRHFPGVMVSSTFTDLKDHRKAAMKAIDDQRMKAVGMEHDSAKPAEDVIDSSLKMVRDSSAYVLLISHKYGQIPLDSTRNPNNLSITELEFNEAQRLNLPTLLFLMDDDHPVHKADVERDPEKERKLDAFRERAKQMKDSSVNRVYATFDSLEDFTDKAIQSVADLRRLLDQPAPPKSPQPDPIPEPPALYAEPPYIGSHKFIGRHAQLDVLDDWAKPANPYPVLLFDAIGGTGKSMLTWEWVNRATTRKRQNWAGIFWYSFYYRGAVMADFCRRALAYISREPLENLNKLKTPELADRLLHHLRSRPWLFVLDGLERVLVAYHRIDAAELPDEQANHPTDQIANRDPCSAIQPEDDDLLRALAVAAPSKLLITSRLIPKVLLNPSQQPIPGVNRAPLPGLRPPDAEALLRSCGIKGNSEAIQRYLTSNCDCHPLVTGVLAGLINGYLPARGNFDAWEHDPSGGGQLNLANLDLIQRRNHILNAALDALPEKSRQLLSTLALISEAVDYPTLSALNPHVPPEPEKVEEVDTRPRSPELRDAPRKLADTVRDLEHRGLLQYDAQTNRWDLHPVVRGVAAGRLGQEQKEGYGQRVVDYFSALPHGPYDDAETLEDLRAGLNVVRTLLKMGRYQQACDAYRGDLSSSLFFNLEASTEALSLLRPFFPRGWATLPNTVDEERGSYLANDAAIALDNIGEYDTALAAYGAGLVSGLQRADWAQARTRIANTRTSLDAQNKLARAERCSVLELSLADVIDDKETLFTARLSHFHQLSVAGRWADAQAMWDLLDPMGRGWSRAAYRPGDAEHYYAAHRYWKGDLAEEDLDRAEAIAGKARATVRYLHSLRGQWRLDRGEWTQAAESLSQAVSMARAVGQDDPASEAQLALAKFHLGPPDDPRREAEQLSNAKWKSPLDLANLWLAIGDLEQAKKHALAAHKWAWADGEPYVFRHYLDRSRALLEKLDVPIPNLPPYDPAKEEKFPWEDAVLAAIEKLRAEKEAKKPVDTPSEPPNQ